LEARDGRKIAVEFVSNVYQVNGEKVIQCNIRDITERKQAEATLRDSEERFRLAALMATDVIYERDMHTGLAVYYGGDIDGILGFPPGGFPRDLEGIADLVHPDDATVVAKAFLEFQATGKPYRVELRVRRADGGYNTFIDKACLVYDEKGLPLKWIGASTDITEKVQAEAALREHQTKLKEQNELLQQRSAALHELVEQLKTEQETLEAKVRANIDQLIRPVLQNAKEAAGQPKVKGYLEIIDKNLRGITSSFGTAIENEWDSLSRREVEVSQLIRDGLSSKRIAELLGISYRSVTAHRRNIRRKLGLKARKINLPTYLRKFK
jgi:DNA-binding CsgD family transcriptional regulator